MRVRKNVFSAVTMTVQILVLAAVILVAHSQAKVRADALIDVTGTITNNSGADVSGASIYATDPGTATVDYGPVTSAADGSYDLQVAAGTYDFHFVPPSGSNLNSAVDSNVTVLNAQTINVQFTPVSNTLTGTLTDQNGNLLHGVNITITNAAGTTASAVTDRGGNFSITAPAAVYTKVAFYVGGTPFYPSSQDYFGANAPVNIDLTNGNATQNLQLSMTTLNVQVNDQNGNPLSGIQVNAFAQGGTIPAVAAGEGTGSFGPSSTGYSGTTSAGGLFSMEVPVGLNFPNGGTSNTNGNICAYIQGSNICLPTSLTVNGATTVTLTAPARYTLTGTLTDQNGNPLPNVTVTIQTQSGTNASTTTDSQGDYSISAPAGTYTKVLMNVNGTPFYPTNQEYFGVEVPVNLNLASSNLSQNLQLDMVTLAVQVNDQNGNPLSGIQVNAFAQGGTIPAVMSGSGTGSFGPGSTGYSGTTNASGLFSVEAPEGINFPNGGAASTSGNICAYIQGSNICLPAALTVTANTTITLTAPKTATLSGVLTDQNGNLLHGITVTFTNTAGTSVSATTDKGGNYSITAPAATYNKVSFTVNGTPFYATSQEYFGANAPVNIDLTNGNATQNLQLSMTTLTVQTRDSSSSPLSGIQVNALAQGGTIPAVAAGEGTGSFGPSSTGYSGSTDASGTFSVRVPVGLNFPNGGAASTSGNICVYIQSVNYCLAAPLTVNRATTVIFQQGQPASVVTPSTPTNLTATSPAQYPVLSWTGVTDADYYNIYRNGHLIDTISATNTTYTDNAAPEGTDAYYVTAVYDSAESLPSNTVSVLVDRTAPTVTYTVTPVSDSNGYNTGNVLVTFNCTDNADGSGIATCTSPTTVNDEGIGQTVAGTATDNAGNTTTVQANASLLNQAISAGSSNANGSYSADTGYFGGTTYSTSASVDTSNVTNPAPQAVYQSSRYGNSFGYTMSGLTPGSNYTLMLQFNEPYFGVGNNGGGVGSRVFNVAINGQLALTNFDIYKTAGGANRAVAEEIPATADENGNVTIQFTSITDNAIVSGIQVFNGSLPPQVPLPAYTFSTSINAGGDSVGDFIADSQFSGGTTYSTSASVDTSNVTNPAPQAVYQSSRYGNSFSYSIPDLVPNATYKVRLDFNEPYFGVGNNGGGVGSRVFNVAINDTQELTNFDIYATAGGANVAVAKDFTVTSDAQGKLTIQFTSITDNAIVSGIEVTPN